MSMVYGLIFYVICMVIAAVARFVFSASALGVFLILALVGMIFHGNDGRIKANHPYPGVAAVVLNQPVGKYWDWGDVDDLDISRENWFGLTIKSTYERPYYPSAVVCSLEGPVYWENGSTGSGEFIIRLRYEFDKNNGRPVLYLGRRRLIVSLVPVNVVAIDAAERQHPADPPTPEQANIVYRSTMPSDYVSEDDTLEWCQVGESMIEVMEKVGLPHDKDGTITKDRVTWIDSNYTISVDKLRFDPE